jgi:hypothetical protein
MSSSSVLDQSSTVAGSSSSTTSNNPTGSNNIPNANTSGTATNTGAAFQPVRNHSESMGHGFESSMQMFGMKQQPMTSPITGTIYTGPPAKYLNSNSNGYAAGGPMRTMIPPQAQNRYGSYNGNNSNSVLSMQPRRQNNSGVDNATNDLVKYDIR